MAVCSCSVASDFSPGPDSDIIWDIAPISLWIYISDDDGKNMLDPEVPAEVFDVSRVTAKWMGKTYKVDSGQNGGVSMSMVGVTFSGLKLDKDSYGRWILSFGEFDGSTNIDNQDLIISWGDGISDTITVFNHFSWNSNGSPSITRRFYVNGKKQDSDIAVFSFVKK